ncbi:MAG: CoA pyrophosphatase, partial [Chloroflexota bacterium]|nr:CoA pyrophosphatase [Chloroflexota bacterium]
GVPLPPPGPARRGAVLVLLYPGETGQAFVALTERATGDLRHPGEVSLPGGAVEEGDESDTAAALREAAEEIGLDPAEAGVEVVGSLDPVDVRVSGFRLVPVVAVAARRPRFRPDPREVASLLEAPLAAFLPDAPIEMVEEERAGRLLRYGAFPVGGHRVWGATARILGQLGALFRGEAGAGAAGAELPPTRAPRSG